MTGLKGPRFLLWGLGGFGLAVAVGFAGVLLIARKSADPYSRDIVPPAVERVVAALPQGSTLVDRAVRLTSDNLKTIGRVVFVSPVPGPEARAGVRDRLALKECGDEVLRADTCRADTRQLLYRVRSAVVGADPTNDEGRALLGARAADFPDGSVAVEVLIGTQ